MQVSFITKDQWVKVLKALAYAFVSTFIVALLAQPKLDKAALAAAAVAGVNAVLVAFKQLFTPNV